MNLDISDLIQLILALIAGIGAIFAFLNIRITKKQIELQQKQWEFKQIPIFRIKFIDENEDFFFTVIENTNNAFYRIESISYTCSDVEVDSNFHGTIRQTRRIKNEIHEKDKHEGLIVMLKIKDNEFKSGILQIQGFDSLGNKFTANTVELKFKEKKLVNHLDVPKTYLKNI